MRFTLNLSLLYRNMANEYDEPISEYLSYEEFISYVKLRGLGVLETVGGDFLVLEVINDED